jgi:hypothetical protein
MELVPPADFVKVTADLIKHAPLSYSRVLFLSSDDEAAVVNGTRLWEKMKMVAVYTKLPRHPLGFSPTWMDSATAGTVTRGHLLQILMALEADTWVGTRGSNWNRLIDELRCVWVDKCTNTFIEVGRKGFQGFNW